jgi:hypothetical protein
MDNNGWPDPARPGVPMNPEQDGWHWVQSCEGTPSCQQWKAGMWSISGEGGWTAAQVSTLLHLRYLGPCMMPLEIADAERKEMSKNNWPDPSPEMLNGDLLFDAIWGVIKSWDINVPAVYSGYCGASGNHARAIRDAIAPVLTPAEVDARVKEAVDLGRDIATRELDPQIALLIPWQTAIEDALSNWCDAVADDETPKDALQRLIRLEVMAALDPAVSQSAADLVAKAKRDALEDCAKWHDEIAAEYKKEQLLYEAKDSWTVAYVFAQGYVINNKRAAAIRALKGEGDD